MLKSLHKTKNILRTLYLQFHNNRKNYRLMDTVKLTVSIHLLENTLLLNNLVNKNY